MQLKIKGNQTQTVPLVVEPRHTIDLEFLDDAGNPVNDLNIISTNSNLSFRLPEKMNRNLAFEIATSMLNWGETHAGTKEDFGRWLVGTGTPVPIPQARTHPLGKGVLAWVYDGATARMASACKDLGMSWVSLKIAEGDKSFGFDKKGHDLLPATVQALRQAGLGVWGWHYVYGTLPEAEAAIAIKRTLELGLDGYMIDAEGEYKQPGRAAAAVRYMAELKKGLGNLPIGLCSFRYPHYHPQLPWLEFLNGGCTFHCQQVYWEQSHNPGEQLRNSVKELKALRDIPIVPIGSVYPVGDWSPTVADLREFNKAVHELKLPGIGWFALHSLIARQDWYDEIKAQAWA